MSWALVAIVVAIAYQVGQSRGIERGMAKALSTNPVSEELEITCAGLWVGVQNRKYFERGR